MACVVLSCFFNIFIKRTMKRTLFYAFALLVATQPLAADAARRMATPSVAVADEDTRKDPELSFYNSSIGILAGESLNLDISNPHKVSPITYSSSDESVCQVDNNGKVIAALVEQTTVVKITATFAGNEEYRPATATVEVGIVPRQPLNTPSVDIVQPSAADNAVVNVTADDPNATAVWYSTLCNSADEFKESDATLSDFVPGQKATITLDHSCTLYVMTRGSGVKSPVVEKRIVVRKPLRAAFTTDKSVVVDYDQEFDSAEELDGWEVGEGWHLDDMKFSSVKPSDKTSMAITYAAGDGQTALTSPELQVKDGSRLEFYGYFKTRNMKWAPWTLEAIDCETGDVVTLLNSLRWVRENKYDSPDTQQWKKISVDISQFAGRTMQFMFDYTFDGENLAVDAFRIVRDNPAAASSISVSADTPILFTSLSEGEPDKTEWSFPGAASVAIDGSDAVVTYSKAGTYGVRLDISRDGQTASAARDGFVSVVSRAPRARFGMPSDAYESPYVGAFVPVGTPVQFCDQSEGTPTEWQWQFSGPSSVVSTEQNPSVVFTAPGVYNAQLTARNAAGEATYALDGCIQAGGKQHVWNISEDETKSLKAIEYDGFGCYAGSNLYGLDRFAEKYKAPLADAMIESVEVFFASTKSKDGNVEIPLAIYDADANGAPGKAVAQTSLKASELQSSSEEIVPTVFTFDKPVELAKGKEFFVVVGPFPNAHIRDGIDFVHDDYVAVYCVQRGAGGKHTTWDQPQYSDSWIANVSDNVSMAIAPLVDYTGSSTAIASAAVNTASQPQAVYSLGGQRVASPQKGTIYVVRYADGTSRKVVW